MEIVTDPDVRSAEQARRYAEELQLLLRAIGASDADMERGQMRVEANVSLRPRGTEPFGTRVEVKNMNSFRSVERAIAFEIERQAAALDAGETLTQDTRGWDEDRGETYVMRSKEDSHDYRYFPEPDLPPLRVDAAWLDEVRGRLPELPAARRDALPGRRSGCRPTTPRSSWRSRDATALFEGALRRGSGARTRRQAANWVTGVVAAAPQTDADAAARVDAAELADLIGRVGARRALRARTRRRSSPSTRRAATARRRDRRCEGLPPDLRRRSARRDRRRGHRREPEGGRGLSGRQAGHRLLRRPGHEGDARPGQRGAGPGSRPAKARRRCRGVSIVNIVLWAGGVVLVVIGYQRVPRSVVPLPGAEGGGRQRRPLRGVAWRRACHVVETGASVAMEVLRRQARIGRRDRDRRAAC